MISEHRHLRFLGGFSGRPLSVIQQRAKVFIEEFLTTSSLALLQSLKESILAQANVKAIYGEPISAEERR